MSKVKTVLKTTRIKLYIDEENLEKKKDQFDLLHKIAYNVYKLCNHLMSCRYAIFMSKNNNFSFKRVHKSIRGELYELTKEYDLDSYIRSFLSEKIYQDFDADCKNGLLTGERSLRNYKKGTPFGVRSTVIKNTLHKTGFSATFSRKKIKFGFVYGRDKGGIKNIILKCISGDYKVSNSQIQLKKNFNTGKYEIFLLLVYRLQVKDSKLDPNISVGIDLGMNTPIWAVLSANYNICGKIGSTGELLHFKKGIQYKRKLLQKELKYSGVGGKGREKKLKILNRYKMKERNFVNTYDHKLAKSLIEFCIKNNAGSIKMENLSSIPFERKNKYILRHWGYYSLQQKIEHKAKYYGIKIKKVNPKNTSRTCPKCGDISEKNRHKILFKCINCDYENNADYVAARNISVL